MKRKFLHWYSHLRFGKKFLLIHSMTDGVVMLLLLLSTASIYIFSQRDQLLEQTASQAKMFGENLTASLTFDDQSSARDVLTSLRNSPYVRYAVLFNVQGNRFAEFSRNHDQRAGQSKPDLQLADRLGQTYQFSWNSLHYLHVVKLNNKKVGYFYIESDVAPIYKQATFFIMLSLIAMGFAAAIGLLLLNRLQRLLMTPLHSLIKIMHLISDKNDYSKRYELHSDDEMGELARGFNQMLEKIQDRNNSLDTELQQKVETEKRLDRLAHYDTVTHLPNRHFFNRSLVKAVSQAPPNEVKFSLMFIDLDNFKMVNDTLGHHMGDILLHKMAQTLRNAVRTEDIVARLGGDEFGVILSNLANAEDAANIARKIIAKISAPTNLDGHDVVVGASIGISFFPADANNIDTLMQNADTAMYQAKSQGKNNFQFFNSEMRLRTQYRMTIETDLRKALEENQLFLEYQPQFDIKTRHIRSVEALLRWQHPELGRISPIDFIPVAEESGLIVPIGEWIFQTACLQLKKWHAQGLQLSIAVNVSGRQFREANLFEQFAHIVSEVGVSASWLELEITESTLIDASETTIKKLNEFANQGFRLAIDDFGTGYSSLSYLKKFPISILKIDRSFILSIQDNSDDKAIAHAIIAMGNSLNMQVIAEGIENEQQAQCLLDFGCDLGQGFLISPAVAPDKIAALCNNKNLILETIQSSSDLATTAVFGR